jgi:hypothetical protein
VVVLSGGSGLFDVDHDVMSVTKSKLIANGIGCDLIFMTNPPLHRVPLFLFKNKHKKGTYYIPHWLHCSYYRHSRNPNQDAMLTTPLPLQPQNRPFLVPLKTANIPHLKGKPPPISHFDWYDSRVFGDSRNFPRSTSFTNDEEIAERASTGVDTLQKRFSAMRNKQLFFHSHFLSAQTIESI